MAESEKLTRGGSAKGASVGKHEDQSVARDYYASISQPQDAASTAEAADERDGVLRDAAVEKLMRVGFKAREAAMAVDAVRAVFAESDRQLNGRLNEQFGHEGNVLGRVEALEALRVMAIKLVQAPKPRFSAGCFLLAAGFDYEGIRSERDWAEQQKISHTHASNEVRDWQSLLHLPKTSAQKSEKACKSYAETNGASAKTL